ncbi:esterase/lipase family protein [Cardinium endosymbiont of Oedothorax gibbosus]|uniref:esterase/lipase family protein n=1 Tax=Cardinium endosymbiont of Oedothorax gibbosus TaxID=931101 RepID=UPI002024DE73|nr:alpha/beta hydrolase [Cardinium endosymbiont of Oedothorax gibbosus]
MLLCLLLIPNPSQAASSKNQHNPLIVLFHGLGNSATSFDTMKQGLEQAFPAASVVALTSVEGMQSINLPIKEQAECSFKELSSKVEHLNKRSMLLIGHSQGGLRAYAFLKQYEALLNIKGLVTLAAPWEGAPGARVDATILSQHLTDPILHDLRMLSLALGYPKTGLEEQLMLNAEVNQTVCLCPGGKDLMEGSAFLCEVQKCLASEKVPILAVGGGQNDFRSLLTRKGTHRFKALNNIYTFFVVGENHPNSRHDMQLPLYSQHALHIISKGKKNFKSVLIKDAFHSTHVWKIPVPKSKAILAHPLALHTVIKFTKSIFQ